MKKKTINTEVKNEAEEAKKENCANGITELVFILDKSGSMGGMERDTICGFNSMIAEQKSVGGKVLVTTVLFSTRSEFLHDRVDVSLIEPLTERDYRVGGGTALLDAIGDTIRHIESIHKYIRPDDIPERTMFVITTDGEENASRRYGSEEIKSLIKECEARGFEFLFVADNIDAVETAANIGIRSDRAANYSVINSTPMMFEAVSNTISCYRKCGSVKNDWASAIDKKPRMKK